MIVEGLRRIQEKYGYLPDEALRALQRELDNPNDPENRVALHHLNEVISFFPHFRRSPPAPLTVKVCRDLVCRMRNSAKLTSSLGEWSRQSGLEHEVHVEEVSCLGRCDRAPAALIELNRPGRHEECRTLWTQPDSDYEACLSSIAEAHRSGRALPKEQIDSTPGPWLIDPYHGIEPVADAPWAAARGFAQALAKDRKAACASFIGTLKESSLRGMGGAGKPAFLKWSEVHTAVREAKYIVCNADESEPATFKDRELLMRAPYLIVESMVLAALLTGAQRGYVYIRHEYYEQIRTIEETIEWARSQGIVGEDVLGTGQVFELEVFVSPGGYVCGEQGALMEAIEGRRAEPRNRPPEPETNGLFDKPTVLNNVETFAWVPVIYLRGAKWYSEAGIKQGAWYEKRREGAKGIRFFSLCGDLENPGVYEAPIGTTLGELIARAGGLRDALPLRSVATSGPSGGFVAPSLRGLNVSDEARPQLPDGWEAMSLSDVPLDLAVFTDLGLQLGAGMVVYADDGQPAMIDQAVSATHFFRNESCGKCVPCRLGSQQLAYLADELAAGGLSLERLRVIKSLVLDLKRTMEQTSICSLGISAPKPLTSALDLFWSELGLTRPIDFPA
jgi:NADH:ubiquinone oxidoreductase subunit F (NADH-binding)/NADH:ubiquinone oxidoreductase subunit E